MSMHEALNVKVELGERSYDVVIGTNLLKAEGLLNRYKFGTTALVVTNSTVGRLYADDLLRRLEVIHSHNWDAVHVEIAQNV